MLRSKITRIHLTQAILTLLQEQWIEDVYIEILKDIHRQLSNSTYAQRDCGYQDGERVRQGTQLHPSCSRQHCMHGEHIYQFKLGEQGQEHRRRISQQSPLCWWLIRRQRNTTRMRTYATRTVRLKYRQIGLKKNIANTKVVIVDNAPINVNTVLIENVEGYTEKNQEKDTTNHHDMLHGWRIPDTGISSKATLLYTLSE